jgi:hypothetical protein
MSCTSEKLFSHSKILILLYIFISYFTVLLDNFFLVLGATYYLSTPNKKDREEWILHIKQALECHFANPEILPFKPSKILLNRPQISASTLCPKSKNSLSPSSVYCKSCGRGFSSSEHVNDFSTMLQLGVEELEKVCFDCKNTQTYVIWFKTMTYLHAMTLHELTPEIGRDIGRYKASFRLRRRDSTRLEMAAQLFEEVRNRDINVIL